MKSEIVIPKVWRSELKTVFFFILMCAVSVFMTQRYPGSVITGEVISIGTLKLEVALPLFWLVPLGALFVGVMRIYDVRYVVDSRGLEARVGILGLNQRITRVRYNDIRSAEIEQSILGRMLNVGDVEVGTAATSDIEIIFEGVAAPQELQDLIQRERDRSLQILAQS